MHSHQERFGLVAQQFQVSQRTWRDHAHHFALDRPFARDLTHLLANGDGFTQLDQARQIGVQGVKGHARHDHRRAGRLAALRQRDVEQP